jgi:hypothetical protein
MVPTEHFLEKQSISQTLVSKSGKRVTLSPANAGDHLFEPRSLFNLNSKYFTQKIVRLRAPTSTIALVAIFFFERTAPDSACFIDIAEEKCNTTILGDHRQEKKRNKKTRLARLDWDINTGYR